MSYLGSLPPLKTHKERHWDRYVGDSFLALGSILLLAETIAFFHLYQRIPDSFLVYLLVILWLASARGLFAALLASFAAFIFYDFLYIPPAYSLLVAKFDGMLALIVFLITAITTARLASALRQRAEEAHQQERETRILYDLVRATNHEEDPLRQLRIFTQTIVEVFSPWGIRDCTLLLPENAGNLAPQTTLHDPLAQVALSSEEEAMAVTVMTNDQTMDLHKSLSHTTNYGASGGPAKETTQKKTETTPANRSCYTRFVPLKTAQKVVGVLRLLIESDPRQTMPENVLGVEQGTHQAVFFATFLEQAAMVIERGRLLRESVQMKVLQQTDALRAALLSSVSHDLRTPLAAIKAAATSLLQLSLDESAWLTFVTAIERECDRLSRLVENLLDMSRIEGGALHPKVVWYPLEELVHDALSRLDVLLQGRTVQVHCSAELPPVELDYVHISQVITNLVENATHYTPADSPIEINIQAQGQQMRVSIADRGPGISPSERERIFDKFYRIQREPEAADQSRGSGLGLAVCRGLVEAHGGRIWMEPHEGGGAIFSFTLPLRKMEEA